MKVSAIHLIGAFTLLGACRVKAHKEIGFGGDFTIPLTPTPAVSVIDSAAGLARQEAKAGARSIRVASFHEGYSGQIHQKPAEAVRSINRSKRPKPLFIDSLPPSTRYNAADSMLAKAQGEINQYNVLVKNQKEENTAVIILIVLLGLVFIILLVSLFILFPTGSLWVDILLVSGISRLFKLVVLSGIVFLIALLAGGGMMIHGKKQRNQMRARAVEQISKAPEFAPSNRRIEYELRSLRMLKNDLSRAQMEAKVTEIRRMMKDDPANPWYPLLRQTAQELQIPWTAL